MSQGFAFQSPKKRTRLSQNPKSKKNLQIQKKSKSEKNRKFRKNPSTTLFLFPPTVGLPGTCLRRRGRPRPPGACHPDARALPVGGQGEGQAAPQVRSPAAPPRRRAAASANERACHVVRRREAKTDEFFGTCITPSTDTVLGVIKYRKIRSACSEVGTRLSACCYHPQLPLLLLRRPLLRLLLLPRCLLLPSPRPP